MKRSKRSVLIPTMQQVEGERAKLLYKKKYKKILCSTASILVVVAAAAVLVSTIFLPVVQVSGSSMEPSLKDGDILLLVKSNRYVRGELCCISWQNKMLLKRVIGLPGDVIEMDEEGNVFVNGELLDEPYVSEKSLGECDIEFPYEVPQEKLFVLGDHRETSIDSRSSLIGSVDDEQVTGRVVLRVYPFNSLI